MQDTISVTIGETDYDLAPITSGDWLRLAEWIAKAEGVPAHKVTIDAAANSLSSLSSMVRLLWMAAQKVNPKIRESDVREGAPPLDELIAASVFLAGLPTADESDPDPTASLDGQ